MFKSSKFSSFPLSSSSLHDEPGCSGNFRLIFDPELFLLIFDPELFRLALVPTVFCLKLDPELFLLDSLGLGDLDGMVLPNEFRFRDVERSLFFRTLLRFRFLSWPRSGDADLEVLLYGDGLRDLPNVFRFALAWAIWSFLFLAYSVGSNRTEGDLDRLAIPLRLFVILDADDERWNPRAELDRDRGREYPLSFRLRPLLLLESRCL